MPINIYIYIYIYTSIYFVLPTPVLLPGKSHGWRSLVGCSPLGRWGSDPTEWLHFHFSLSCTGEGNNNPLQCSCLENPRDGGAWWAAAYGVAQSQTRLKRLSSSSSMGYYHSAPWFLYLIYFRHFKSKILFFYLDITKIKCLVNSLKFLIKSWMTYFNKSLYCILCYPIFLYF